MKVLVITRSEENDSVTLVTEELLTRGAQVVRFDTDRYPQDVKVKSIYGSGLTQQIVALGTNSGYIELQEFDSVWYRRFSAGNALPASLGDTFDACRDEARLTLYGTIVSLDCFHLDPVTKVRGTDYKELQVREAVRLGLTVPPTLFTNDPNAVLQFAAKVRGDLITKVQGHFAIYRDGLENVVYTNRLKPGDLTKLGGLRYSPMIFQQAVSKKLELRATVVGRQVFCGAIDSQQSERAETDWRRDGNRLLEHWHPHELPKEVAEKLLRLADFFGLNYAAADFILCPDGEYHFLEINAAGEWLWLQQICGLPISQAIAEVLTEPTARRLDRVTPDCSKK